MSDLPIMLMSVVAVLVGCSRSRIVEQTIVIDGIASTSEWDSAQAFQLSDESLATDIFVDVDSSTLYVRLDGLSDRLLQTGFFQMQVSLPSIVSDSTTITVTPGSRTVAAMKSNSELPVSNRDITYALQGRTAEVAMPLEPDDTQSGVQIELLIALSDGFARVVFFPAEGPLRLSMP